MLFLHNEASPEINTFNCGIGGAHMSHFMESYPLHSLICYCGPNNLAHDLPGDIADIMWYQVPGCWIIIQIYIIINGIQDKLLSITREKIQQTNDIQNCTAGKTEISLLSSNPVHGQSMAVTLIRNYSLQIILLANVIT